MLIIRVVLVCFTAVCVCFIALHRGERENELCVRGINNDGYGCICSDSTVRQHGRILSLRQICVFQVIINDLFSPWWVRQLGHSASMRFHCTVSVCTHVYPSMCYVFAPWITESRRLLVGCFLWVQIFKGQKVMMFLTADEKHLNWLVKKG